MKKFALLMIWVCTFALTANAAPSRAWWRDWIISSSEELSQGEKYRSYPLPLLFDGDARTAWIYSATSKEWDKSEWSSRYGLKMTPSHPIILDGLRLMNGHNGSAACFARNNRATRIRVALDTTSGQWQKEFALSDAMGWHTLALPRRTAKNIKIEFIGIRRGIENDLCLSELQLMRDNRPIDLHMPRAVMFNDGLESCGVLRLISRNGTMLDGIGTDDGSKDAWSQNGRFVAGSAGPDDRLWIADTWRGKVIVKHAKKTMLQKFGIAERDLYY